MEECPEPANMKMLVAHIGANPIIFTLSNLNE